MLVTGAAEQPRLERDRRGPAAEAFLNPELKLRVLAAIIDLQATKQRRDEWSEETHSMKVLSIAAAAGLTGAFAVHWPGRCPSDQCLGRGTRCSEWRVARMAPQSLGYLQVFGYTLPSGCLRISLWRLLALCRSGLLWVDSV
jgi:hypothetical protein